MTGRPDADPAIDGQALAKASMVRELRQQGMKPVQRKPVEQPDSDFDFPVLKTARR